MSSPSESRRILSDMDCDVCIVGSGPIGATYARNFIDAGFKVIMVEAGSADSLALASSNATSETYVPGAHKLNQIVYQNDNLNSFMRVVQGALKNVAPPPDLVVPTIDPAVFQSMQTVAISTKGTKPQQDQTTNLAAEAVTHSVGGMATHWSCTTPELHPTIERPKLEKDQQDDQELWKNLYEEARILIGTSTTEFNRSIRHVLVLKTLQDAYKQQGRVVESMPLACHREANPDYVNWHGTDTILRQIYTDPAKKALFTLLTDHLCVRVVAPPGTQQPLLNSREQVAVSAVEVIDLRAGRGPGASRPPNDPSRFYIKAKVFIVAAGAVNTPQILYKSALGIRNVGEFITEQPVAFCQIIMKQTLIDSVRSDPYDKHWWAKKVKEHTTMYPSDLIPMDFWDPDPQVLMPVSKQHPWHGQIHRGAFSFGIVPESIDRRLLVDLRFYSYVQPRRENRINFDTSIEDQYGMPQPTFKFQMSPDDGERAHKMMADMCNVAEVLGGYIPGAEPQFLTPGMALNLAGTVRADLYPADSVADTNGQVWGFENLYVAGNGVIPTGFAANPTLTSLCYALKSAYSIVPKLQNLALKDGTYNIINKRFQRGMKLADPIITSTGVNGDSGLKWRVRYLAQENAYTIKSFAEPKLFAAVEGNSRIQAGDTLVARISASLFAMQPVEPSGLYRIILKGTPFALAATGVDSKIVLIQDNYTDLCQWKFASA